MEYAKAKAIIEAAFPGCYVTVPAPWFEGIEFELAEDAEAEITLATLNQLALDLGAASIMINARGGYLDEWSPGLEVEIVVRWDHDLR